MAPVPVLIDDSASNATAREADEQVARLVGEWLRWCLATLNLRRIDTEKPDPILAASEGISIMHVRRSAGDEASGRRGKQKYHCLDLDALRWLRQPRSQVAVNRDR